MLMVECVCVLVCELVIICNSSVRKGKTEVSRMKPAMHELAIFPILQLTKTVHTARLGR